jgi:quercetin dioxygenase-like cupin family protein
VKARAPVVGVLLAVAPALALAACGDDSDPPERREGALGGSASTETIARLRLRDTPGGPLVWTAHEVRLMPGQMIEHEHQPAFVYARSGQPSLEGGADGAAVEAGVRHRHEAGDAEAVYWEIRLARSGAPPPPGVRDARPVFESDPLEGIPAPAEASLIEVRVPPRGGSTTVHTHPGPEFIHQLSGRIDYQNEIVGTKLLGPGDAEGIPPGTAVQKRNPYLEPATFLSLFLVDPDRPFAPGASF